MALSAAVHNGDEQRLGELIAQVARAADPSAFVTIVSAVLCRVARTFADITPSLVWMTELAERLPSMSALDAIYCEDLTQWEKEHYYTSVNHLAMSLSLALAAVRAVKSGCPSDECLGYAKDALATGLAALGHLECEWNDPRAYAIGWACRAHSEDAEGPPPVSPTEHRYDWQSLAAAALSPVLQSLRERDVK